MKPAFVLSAAVVGAAKRLWGADITVTGEALPPMPVLFVANHFTRFETFVVPYMLYRKFGRTSRSLADDSLFVGTLGRVLRWVGTISNRNKERDCIIIEDLLKGASDWIIYPEGFMVKNKRITFDNKEFCIHAPEYEGPVHTGAAVMAIKARLAQLRAKESSKAKEEARAHERFCTAMGIDAEGIDPALQIRIVPITITYYPIRPGKNRFLVWLDTLIHQRDTRFFEELEIEVNLLLDARMNIHIGEAIPLERYVDEKIKDRAMLYDMEAIERFVDRQRRPLTNRMMKRVYSNTQINFDHIFILSLVTMPTVKVCPSYLKTLIYKNARTLREMSGYRLHPGLQSELFKLILDDAYAPFVSAIDLALKQHILFLDSDGEYLFDRSLLEKHYPFHKVRVKNTLQVILNEIKWQKPIEDMAIANAKYSEEELREDNFAHLKEREWAYYEEEYRRYHGRAPREDEKGAPIILYNPEFKSGLVFSHGYMAAPREIETLAHYLFDKGINVYVPRLRGHGTDPEALKHITAHDWEVDFERAFTAMRQVCDRVFIGGFSTGGLLALIDAAKYRCDGVIALNSALKLHDLRVSYVVPSLQRFNEMIAYLHAKGVMEWIDNSHSERPEVNYNRHPLSSVAQMEKIMHKAAAALPKIKAPILIIQGDKDPVVKRESARTIYDRVASTDKKLLLLPRDHHAILSDESCTEIFEAIERFIASS